MIIHKEIKNKEEWPVAEQENIDERMKNDEQTKKVKNHFTNIRKNGKQSEPFLFNELKINIL